jgi:NTE family protein
LNAPVRLIPTDDGVPPVDGVGLCLSGGGYRAMLFHLGALWRLHELDWLRKLDRISSVSGGSITAATLALAWPHLDEPDAFKLRVVTPLRMFALRNVDEAAIAVGLLTPDTIGERVSRSYREYLFGQATLQDLPKTPRFIINATNLASD